MQRPDLLIQTKLDVPFIRPDLVSRQRLQAQIAMGLHGPLTLVVAPAGFGKTTLVVSSVVSSGMPVAWLSLDADDNQINPKDSSPWIEVRGRVSQITQEGAEAHADKLTQRYYHDKQHFYGDIYPVEQKYKETRVVVRIEPIKVLLDAIFK